MKEHIFDYLYRMDLLQKNDILHVVELIFIILITASLIFFIWGKVKPQANLNELISRTNSWWVMVFLFIAAVLLDRVITFPALALLSFVAFRELYSMIGFRNIDRRPIFWAFLAIPVQYYLAYIGWYELFIIFIPVWMFLFMPVRMVIAGDTKGIIKSMASLQWSMMITVYGISHLAYFLSLPDAPNFTNGGQGLLLFVVFLTEINDVLQFLWGKMLGKHKITPSVSPNKTWEGFIGGVVSTTIISYFLGFLTPLTDVQVVLGGIIIACSGFFGDIVMSAIKRDIVVKDTGTAIPGHGGVLDRIDSLTYTAPVFFHFVYYIVF